MSESAVTEKLPLPDRALIKGLPKNADIARSSTGRINVLYRYRSKSDLARSGGKTMKHLGIVRELRFIPAVKYQLHPEDFPIPEKQLKGARIPMLLKKKDPAATSVPSADSEKNSRELHPLEDASKSTSMSAGATVAMMSSGYRAGIHKALFMALAKTFAPKGIDPNGLYKQILSVALHTAVRGEADRHLEAFCETYVTPCRMTSQSASKLYELLGTNINELRQNFFEETAKLVSKDDKLSVDGTYYNCEGKNISFAQVGLSKDKTFRKQIAQLIVYSTKTGLPVMYMTNPGNMHDSQTLTSLKETCRSFGFADLAIMLLLDRAFIVAEQMIAFKHEKTDFLGCAKIGLKFVEHIKRESADTLRSLRSYITAHGFHGVTKKVLLQENDPESSVFVHVYYKASWADADMKRVMTKIEAFKHAWDHGKRVPAAAEEVREFFRPLEEGKSAEVDFDKLDKHAAENFGFFALVSSNVSDAATAARLYGLRNSAEICFKLEKSLDRKTARSHNEATFLGKDFTTFVATMLASTMLRRLGDWKNDNSAEEEIQPLNRNHDYKDLLHILSAIRVNRQVGAARPELVNFGGKAKALLGVLDLMASFDTDTKALLNMMFTPPKYAVEECRKLGLLG